MTSLHSTRGMAAAFQTTHWSLVNMAGQSDSPQAREALSSLCRMYWPPVYAYLRRRGFNRDEAKDYTQELFARLLEKHTLQIADREKGRFRNFLLSCLEHFLSQQRKRDQALKRGGGYTLVPFDEALAENCDSAASAEFMSPEQLFDRQWALTLLEQTLVQLQQEYAESGKGMPFEVLHVFLPGAQSGQTISYSEAAARLQLSESALRQAIHRLRRRFGEILRLQVAQTVASPTELEAELMHLKAVLST